MSTRPAQILRLLQARSLEFQQFDRQLFQALQTYRDRFEQLTRLPLSSLGAAESLDRCQGGIIPWGLQWPSREASLQWVREQLTGVETFAVDGSQIYPSKDISIPIALVQVGWFMNRHHPQGDYEKDIRLDVLTPLQLRDPQGKGGGDWGDRLVNQRRFQMEIDRLREYFEAQAGNPHCLAFLDGSLVAHFAQKFDPETRQVYCQALVQLIRSSEDNRVPLIAYIDTSYATDLTGLLAQGFDLGSIPPGLHDAQLVNPQMAWGDRTPLLRCQGSLLTDYYGDQHDRLGFLYLKTNDSYPARVEMPLWIAEEGRLEQVLNWLRGEIIIGNGYPYAIETADQVAVLQSDDRATFYRLVQDWAEREGLNLRLSRKMMSKRQRR